MVIRKSFLRMRIDLRSKPDQTCEIRRWEEMVSPSWDLWVKTISNCPRLPLIWMRFPSLPATTGHFLMILNI